MKKPGRGQLPTIPCSALRPVLFFAAIVLVIGLSPEGPKTDGRLWAKTPDPAKGRIVYLGHGLSDEKILVLTAAVAAGNGRPVLLLDAPNKRRYLKAFLAAYRPDRVVPVGNFPDGTMGLEKQLGVRLARPFRWPKETPGTFYSSLFPRAERVVVSAAGPRGLVLQAACLAGLLRAPLFVLHGRESEGKELNHWLTRWQTRQVFVAGRPEQPLPEVPNVRLVKLAEEKAVQERCINHLHARLGSGAVATLVVANPADGRPDRAGMSLFAPWVACQKGAPLLLTNAKGDNANAVVEKALHNPCCRHADHLLVVADLKAIPMERRPNPIQGKDKFIEMEPMTPRGWAPFSFATGRLFQSSRSVLTLVLARPRL